MKKLLLLCLLFAQLNASGQSTDLSQPQRHWFLPDHVKLQFAGGTGFLSGGPGYISKNRTLETDFLFGYLPEEFGGDALITITGKTTYSPWSVPLRDSYYIKPFSAGIYLSYTFGPQFDWKWPSYYPKGYYWWATSVRPGLYIGGKVGRDVTPRTRKRQVELYYELGTYDLLLISYVQNTGFLKPGDILNLALGVKFGF
ncbi:hypothetical protein [Dyadobacter crusticola]|uniref:hypothetical protein n=1 Tax=Dyadobacter crusticola TaxID=292407 RepID=UPI0004E18868|nr:hypothetical protein [Dyadobacter crusticola]